MEGAELAVMESGGGPENPVRTKVIEGETWFNLGDVAKLLGKRTNNLGRDAGKVVDVRTIGNQRWVQGHTLMHILARLDSPKAHALALRMGEVLRNVGSAHPVSTSGQSAHPVSTSEQSAVVAMGQAVAANTALVKELMRVSRRAGKARAELSGPGPAAPAGLLEQVGKHETALAALGDPGTLAPRVEEAARKEALAFLDANLGAVDKRIAELNAAAERGVEGRARVLEELTAARKEVADTRALLADIRRDLKAHEEELEGVAQKLKHLEGREVALPNWVVEKLAQAVPVSLHEFLVLTGVENVDPKTFAQINVDVEQWTTENSRIRMAFTVKGGTTRVLYQFRDLAEYWAWQGSAVLDKARGVAAKIPDVVITPEQVAAKVAAATKHIKFAGARQVDSHALRTKVWTALNAEGLRHLVQDVVARTIPGPSGFIRIVVHTKAGAELEMKDAKEVARG